MIWSDANILPWGGYILSFEDGPKDLCIHVSCISRRRGKITYFPNAPLSFRQNDIPYLWMVLHHKFLLQTVCQSIHPVFIPKQACCLQVVLSISAGNFFYILV